MLIHMRGTCLHCFCGNAGIPDIFDNRLTACQRWILIGPEISLIPRDVEARGTATSKAPQPDTPIGCYRLDTV